MKVFLSLSNWRVYFYDRITRLESTNPHPPSYIHYSYPECQREQLCGIVTRPENPRDADSQTPVSRARSIKYAGVDWMPSQGPVRYEFSLMLPTEFIQVVFFIIRTFPCGLNPLFRNYTLRRISLLCRRSRIKTRFKINETSSLYISRVRKCPILERRRTPGVNYDLIFPLAGHQSPHVKSTW